MYSGRSALTAFACLLVIAHAATQSQLPTFRTGVDIVRLDVVVLDENRRPVRGLNVSDFLVVENGKPQPIVAFKEVDLPDATPRVPWMREAGFDVASNEIDAQRLVVIVIDDAHINFDPSASNQARLVGERAIDRLGPADLAAVVYTFRGRNQNFTADKSLLKAAVDVLVPHPNAAGCHGCDVQTLARVADVLRDASPGRKLLIYISGGRDISGTMSEDTSGGHADVQEMFAKLQEANIAVYAFDPHGLQTTAPTASDARRAGPTHVASRPVNESLRSFADSTGGRAFTDSNTPFDDVPAVFAENSSYYLVGFQPDNIPADRRFRHIRVHVNRRGVHVQTRNGYFTPKQTPKRSEALSPLEAALAHGLPTGDIPMHVSIAAFATSDRRKADVFSTVQVRVPVDGESRMAHVLATAFDENWNARGSFHKTLELPPGSGESVQEIVDRFVLPPGRYELRFAVESSGRSGGLFVDIQVPKFEKEPLSMSAVVIEKAASPTTVRDFSRRDVVRALVRVYQGGTGKLASPQVSMSIINSRDERVAGETIVIDARRFGQMRATDYQVDMPIDRLDSGDYLLTIEAELRNRRVRRDVRFRVQ